eukprot:TRINITY_DN1844_c0_g1_i1.p1 TRINITY_DN1844_c0_g1~~TRINITY_DN1844_c0_g1_i1.p1  ORF type:complete len:111 (-),score=20.61 TRINITY_DN1844_c0_g1_i1:207-539(-)
MYTKNNKIYSGAESEQKTDLFSLINSDEQWSLMIIPQASLSGKVKSNRIQYHNQPKKDDSELLYESLVNELKNLVEENIEERRIIYDGVFGNRQGLEVISSGPYSHFYEN